MEAIAIRLEAIATNSNKKLYSIQSQNESSVRSVGLQATLYRTVMEVQHELIEDNLPQTGGRSFLHGFSLPSHPSLARHLLRGPRLQS